MRNFTFLLVLLNLVYLAWNFGVFSGVKSKNETASIVVLGRTEQSLQLLSELASEKLVLIDAQSEELAGSRVEEPSSMSIDESADENAEESSDVEFVIALEQGEAFEDILQCLSIGSFTSSEASDAAGLELSNLGYLPTTKTLDIKADPDYWVHMPPFNSMTAARERLAELQEKEIDSYIISEAEGELAQGISLGLFGEMARALVLQSQLAEEGYPSSIYEVERSNNEIWIEINGLTALEIDQLRVLESIISQSGLKVEEKLCETIAPEA